MLRHLPSVPRTPTVLALAALLGTGASMPLPAAAQLVQETHVRADNDNFNFWLPRRERGDHEYTHGAWIRVTTRSAPLWGQRFASELPVCSAEQRPGRCLLTAWEVGQRIYTPRSNEEQPVDGERPYAGWLYGAATAIAQQAADRHSVRLELGVTGPPSLAGPAQRVVHQVGGWRKPIGWHNQIDFEPGLLVRYGYDRLLAAPTIRDVPVAEIASSAGAAVGNVATGANLGASARLGFNVPRSWASARPREDVPSSVYAVAGVRVDGYLRNLFLDGSTGRPSIHVEKYPLVQSHHIGLAARVQQVDFAFSVTTRTREYRTEPSGHRFSTFTITLRR